MSSKPPMISFLPTFAAAFNKVHPSYEMQNGFSRTYLLGGRSPLSNSAIYYFSDVIEAPPFDCNSDIKYYYTSTEEIISSLGTSISNRGKFLYPSLKAYNFFQKYIHIYFSLHLPPLKSHSEGNFLNVQRKILLNKFCFTLAEIQM